MSANSEYYDYLLEQLEPLGPVSVRRMFGGAGIFYGSVMFALVADEELFLKVDEASQVAFEEAGTGPFTYESSAKPKVMKSYWRVPDEILDDADDLVAWSRVAVDVALAADRAKQKKKAGQAKKSKKTGKN